MADISKLKISKNGGTKPVKKKVPKKEGGPSTPARKKIPVKKKPASSSPSPGDGGAATGSSVKKKTPVKKKPTTTSSPRSNGGSSPVKKKKPPIKKHPANNQTKQGRNITRNKENKIQKPAATIRKPQKPNDGFVAGDEDDPFANADPSKWRVKEQKFSGSSRFESKGKEEKFEGKSIRKGIQHFKANPKEYIAMLFQASMLEEKWPDDQCEYSLVHREGTSMYQPQGISDRAWMTILLQEYEALPSYKNNILPEKYRDEYTDNMTFRGRKLHSQTNPPVMPGRGMGVCDAPNIKVIGDVDPSDIHQGQVGDCWLLSGISSLAEFDGAIKRLFRKTPGLDKMPRVKPNKYVITYWDLTTWKEVDIEIDERLAAAPNGGVLAAKPSADGELWACYLEKAFAIHAGGWDKIVGGQCAHAWAVMTGCKYQYSIQPDKKTGLWYCALRYNPREKKWGKHGNSPHDCDGVFYQSDWPEVGGGGSGLITEEELFQKMCAWDDVNYIIGAGTTGSSDANTTGGMVDNHAYSVIECHDDVAGTPIDLIKVRNPWGKGEIEDGEFDDDGPGWDNWPQVKAELNPVVADDGIFYVTPKEFFKFFGTIYLSASDMTEFLED